NFPTAATPMRWGWTLAAIRLPDPGRAVLKFNFKLDKHPSIMTSIYTITSPRRQTLTGRLLLTVLIFSLVGCGEEFLERKPKGQLTFDTYFETSDHAIWATNAIYQHFRSWEMCAFPWIGLTDILSDDADKGSTPNDALYMLELDEFTFDPTNQA